MMIAILGVLWLTAFGADGGSGAMTYRLALFVLAIPSFVLQ